MMGKAGTAPKDLTGRGLILPLHTLAHFAVDFTCYYFLMTTDWGLGFPAVAFIYVMLAFALQFFLGMLADLRPDLPLLTAGLCLILLAFPAPGPARLALMGVGNALFHTYAGRTVLKYYSYGANGIFNGAGGCGLVFGTFCGLHGAPFAAPLLLLLPLTALEGYLFLKPPAPLRQAAPEAPERYCLRSRSTGMWAAAVFVTALASVLAERTLLGAGPVKPDAGWLYLLTGAGIWLAKAIGSFVCGRKFEPKALAAVSLMIYTGTLAGPRPALMWLTWALLAAINLYPLYGLKRLLKDQEGLAFGLNKLGLAAAFCLSLVPKDAFFLRPAGLLFLLCVILAAMIKEKEVL